MDLELLLMIITRIRVICEICGLNAYWVAALPRYGRILTYNRI